MAIVADVAREDWGARPFPRAHTSVTHTHLEFHHDVYPASWTPIEHARSIERDHFNKGWNGPFYNLGLASDGDLWELRGVGRRSQGSALTVVLFGDFHPRDADLGGDRPTAAQLATMRRLITAMPDDVTYHAERAAGTKYASVCPGSTLIPIIRDLRATTEENDMTAVRCNTHNHVWAAGPGGVKHVPDRSTLTKLQAAGLVKGEPPRVDHDIVVTFFGAPCK